MSVAQNQCRRRTFEELVKLYWRKRRSPEEASGILRASLQAKHTSTSSPDDASEEVAAFLMVVGSEMTQRERNSELREEARRYLARHVGERSFSIKASPQIVQELRNFYGESPRHTPSSSRDREHVHAFLRVTMGEIGYAILMRLSITVGDYAWLADNSLYEAIPLLYKRLFAMLRERGGKDFERLAKVHDVGEMIMTRFPDALQMIHVQPEGLPQIQTDYFMKLVRMHTLCGIAFTHYNDEQLRECARTLLYLASCSAVVNGNHYDADH